ncbi:hypothetical protein C7E25_24515, partial [Stenotrophomonas maltophilia]
EIRNLLVTTQAANGSAADSALQQMFNIAASTGSAAAIAAASAEIRNLLVTTQAANGSAADSALQQMFNIAASTGS